MTREEDLCSRCKVKRDKLFDKVIICGAVRGAQRNSLFLFWNNINKDIRELHGVRL